MLQIATLKGIPLYDQDIEVNKGILQTVARTNCRYGWIIASYPGVNNSYRACSKMRLTGYRGHTKRVLHEFSVTSGCTDGSVARRIWHSLVPECLIPCVYGH
jgi:hypothetical protein